MKNINEENNEDISKKIPLDISEIKENNNNKSLFCSGVSLENNIEQKNAYNTNTYNIRKNFSNSDSKDNIIETDLNNRRSEMSNNNNNNNKSENKSNSKNIESDIIETDLNNRKRIR